jgi:hypothetical protein
MVGLLSNFSYISPILSLAVPIPMCIPKKGYFDAPWKRGSPGQPEYVECPLVGGGKVHP